MPNQDTEVDGILDRAIIKGQDPKAHAIAVDEAKTALNQCYKSILLDVLGGDDELVMPKDLADHWSLTESGIKRVLENGKKLGKNELRADLRQRLESRLGK